MRNLSIWEILLIVLGIILLFGAAKLPQLGRAVGESIKEFKKSVKNDDSNDATEGEKKV